MLNTLPLEITLRIITHLPFCDKYQLSGTCSSLYGQIAHWGLYEHLVLSATGNEGLSEIFDVFKSKRLNGHQVKKLEINLNELSDDLYSQLALTFPKVSCLLNRTETSEIPRPEHIVETLGAWKNTIEHCNIASAYLNIVKLMEKYTFSRLTTLDVSLFTRNITTNAPQIQLFDILENAPLLQRLTIRRCEVNIAFIERIHTSRPLLSRLVFHNVLFSLDQDSLPNKMEPATHLLHFVLQSKISIIDRNLILLDFIVQKYTHLELLDFYGVFNKDILRNYFYTAGYFNEFGVVLTEFPYGILVDNYNITRDLYFQHGGARLLSYLPNSIKTLYLNEGIFGNTVESLAKSNIRPTCIGFGNEYSHHLAFRTFEQLQYLGTLTTMKTLRMSISASMDTYSRDVVISDTITHLTANVIGGGERQRYNEIDISYLLTAFPSLITLEIVSYSVRITVNYRENFGFIKEGLFPNLRKLDIKAGNIDNRVITFTQWNTPNLKVFGWSAYDGAFRRPLGNPSINDGLENMIPLIDDNSNHARKEYKIDMRGHKLDVLHLHTQLSKAKILLSIQAPKKRKQYFFFYNAGRKPENVVELEEGQDKNMNDMISIAVGVDTLKLFKMDSYLEFVF